MSDNKLIKWKYYHATVWFEITKPVLLGPDKGEWKMAIGKVVSLEDGMNHMGDLGYELVGLHPIELDKGALGDLNRSEYFYIFKKPI
jgi:hypothetical protein